MKKGSGFSFFGVTSLIVVVIVLMMVCLSVLTYVNSNNDYNLAEKAVASNALSYEAEVEAAHRLSALAEKLDSSGSVAFQVNIDENRYLDCEAVFDDDHNLTTISCWKITLREQ